MSAASPLRASRLWGLLPGDAARRAAVGWAALALLAVALAGSRAAPGAAEGSLFDAARRQGQWWTRLPIAPLDSLGAIPAALGPEAGVAPLPLAAAGVGQALLGERLPEGRLIAFRLAAAIFAGLLAYVLSRFGGDLAGPTGALLAPALTFLVPAAFAAAIPAVGTAVPAAALWLGVLLAHHRGMRSRDRRERFRRAAVAGLLFGAALAVRRDAWALLPLLAFHYLAVRARGGIRALTEEEEGAHHAQRSLWRSLLAGLPGSLPAMLVLGPLVFAAVTPWTWIDPVHRFLPAARAALAAPPFVHLGALVSEGRAPWHAPLLAALLLPPAAIAFLYAGGLLHSLRRLVLGWRREAAASFSDELLLLLGALAPLVLAATGVTPREAGLGPALPAIAVLSVLGARAVATAARTAWPSRAPTLALAVCLLTLYPAARATVRTFPHGAGAWSEWIGGAPGAASLGLPRLTSGAGGALLGALRERAAAGQRVWWPSLPPGVLEALRHDGLLRADLRIAASPAEADLAVIEQDETRRDVEYQVWTAFGTARPVAVERLDEVPLASVYARPGAWR